MVGQFTGEIAVIDVKNMMINELGKFGSSKIEHLCKLSKNLIAIATCGDGLLLAKYDISMHTGLIDLEPLKKNGSFL